MQSTSHAHQEKKLKPMLDMNFEFPTASCLESHPSPHTHFCSGKLARGEGPRQNFLLAALPDEEYERIAPHLEPFFLPRAEILYRFDERLEYTYFPTTATVSLLCTMEDGASIEVAVVGDEGLLGASILGDGALTQAMVLNPGDSYRLNAKWLKSEIEQHGYLQPLLMRYTRTLMTQMTQTTGCIRRHSVDQQLCRCLLLNLDRASCASLSMTQEMMAGMLGVRRESITEVARKLQSAKLISYNRGQIKILNRPGLEARACECYDVMKSEFGRLHADLLAA